MKFIHNDNKKKDDHWKQCEKLHAPFIVISKFNDEYMNIFYDISNYNTNLDEISNDIKKLYFSYVEFFMLSDLSLEYIYDQYYFFNIIVKNEHSEFIADKLYDYLLARIKAK